MIRLGASQPYFFPYIGYFQLINAVDKFILYDRLSYIKHGWIAGNRIGTPHGNELHVNIPVKKRSSNKLICDLAIDNEKPWQRKLIKQLQTNYGRAAYYPDLFPFFEDLLIRKYELLSEFNCISTGEIAGLLNIKTDIIRGSNGYLDVEERLREYNGCVKRKTQRIFYLCEKENADTWINAIGGTQLYFKREFEDKGIELLFIKTDHHFIHNNVKTPVPELSIIDTLFTYGVDGTRKMLDCYKLI